jgi:hypothetical protein
MRKLGKRLRIALQEDDSNWFFLAASCSGDMPWYSTIAPDVHPCRESKVIGT